MSLLASLACCVLNKNRLRKAFSRSSGAKQQRCFECNELVSWCCARCTFPNAIVPLHPTVAQGSKRKYDCLTQHHKNQCGGYKVTHQTCTGTSTDSKRRRKVRIQFI